MDKSDMEMEDSEKESQGGLDDVKEKKDFDFDAKMEDEARKESSLANADYQMFTEVEAKKQNDGETASDGDKQSSDEAEATGQTNSKIEVLELSNTIGMVDDSCIAKMEVEAQSSDSIEAEDQSNSSVKNEIKETIDSQNAAEEQDPSKDGKTSGDPVESKAEAKKAIEEEKSTVQNGQLPFQLPVSAIPPKKKEVVDEDHQTNKEGTLKGMVDQVHNRDTEAKTNELKEPENKSILPATALTDETASKKTKHEPRDTSAENKRQSATPDLPIKCATRSGGHSGSGQTLKNVFDIAKMPESDEGTPEEQAAFMKGLESFYRERSVEFKPPKFYGQQLNCLKLWRSVIRLGGYDRVTGSKLWRQVGESFHPPKTCTTVSWTFRIFYEKSLLDYERYQRQCGELELPVAALAEPSSAEEGNGYQASGSGRARRDAAARAMQGWHAQQLVGLGEDKNVNNMPKRENKLKSIGSLKQKRPNEIEIPVKAQRTETSKQLVTNVVDIGPPADWVKINIRETKDSFEVYALVPGLLREEVRVQSDPAGRLVITGQPEQPDNPWGITPFKKVVSLPARIDPLQTSAAVSLHGRLCVRVPFEKSNI